MFSVNLDHLSHCFQSIQSTLPTVHSLSTTVPTVLSLPSALLEPGKEKMDPSHSSYFLFFLFPCREHARCWQLPCHPSDFILILAPNEALERKSPGTPMWRITSWLITPHLLQTLIILYLNYCACLLNEMRVNILFTCGLTGKSQHLLPTHWTGKVSQDHQVIS